MLADHAVSGFNSTDLSTLAGSKFIPAQGSAQKFELYTPRQVYFKAQEGGLAPHFHSLFTFVDFGTTPNSFLLLCGVRAEPSTAELCVVQYAHPECLLIQTIRCITERNCFWPIRIVS